MKKNISKLLVCGLVGALMCCMLALVACGGSSSSSNSSSSSSNKDTSASKEAPYKLVTDGVLTVATEPEYPPLEYQEGSEIMGYDIDLIKEIGKRLDLKVDIQNQTFDTLVTQVAAGTKFDCAISAITITDERGELVLFTDPYMDSNLSIVVLGDSAFTSKSDLNGLPIGAQSGTSGEDWAKENLKDSPYTPFEKTPDLLAALRTGKIVAAIYDEPVAKEHVSGEYQDCQVLEVIPTGEQYGIIVNLDNPGLAEAINQAYADMVKDGTVKELQIKWFGAELD